MCIPGPIPGAPLRSAMTEWRDLYQDFLHRFKPGHSGDEAVLRLQLGFPPARTIRFGASPNVRSLIMEFAWPDRMERPVDYHTCCRALLDYCHQFVELSANLDRQRKDYFDQSPWDDPMRIDEAVFRAVEAAVLTDLLARAADENELDEIGLEAIKAAHLVPIRHEEVPRPFYDVATGVICRRKYRARMLEMATAMKTQYEYANELMGTDPTVRPMAMLVDLVRTIEDTLGELDDPSRLVEGLKFVRRSQFEGEMADPATSSEATSHGKDTYSSIFDGQRGTWVNVEFEASGDVPRPTMAGSTLEPLPEDVTNRDWTNPTLELLLERRRDIEGYPNLSPNEAAALFSTIIYCETIKSQFRVFTPARI